MNNTAIEDHIIKSYRETNYHIFSQPAFTLEIGNPSLELMNLHKKYSVDCSAFITAYNPFSHEAIERQNIDRNTKLANQLREQNHVLIEGIGKHPSNQWPGEPSFLVLGITLDAAKKIGMQFEQNAIVWSDSDATPELVLLR